MRRNQNEIGRIIEVVAQRINVPVTVAYPPHLHTKTRRGGKEAGVETREVGEVKVEVGNETVASVAPPDPHPPSESKTEGRVEVRVKQGKIKSPTTTVTVTPQGQLHGSGVEVVTGSGGILNQGDRVVVLLPPHLLSPPPAQIPPGTKLRSSDSNILTLVV